MPITQAELGRRVRSAREACGLTQDSLAQQVSLSRTAIVQIEQGKRAVSSIELDQIAFALGRDMRDFFADEFRDEDALVALFRLQPELVNQDEVVEALRTSMALGRETSNLERQLGIDQAELVAATYPLNAPGRKMEAIQQGERIAREERQRLGLGSAPVSDLTNLLESQGVRTAMVDLPNNISGLTLSDAKVGLFVVINRRQHLWRRRFSMVHEYGHVLMDRSRLGTVSRDENRSDLIEVRANAFTAEFLMPAEGVRQFVAALGKGRQSRSSMTIFDEGAEVQVEGRAAPGSQDIQIYDVALLAHHFGVSRQSALYRLKNLRLVDDAAFQHLKAQEDSGQGRAVADFLELPEPDHQGARDEFRRRFLGLALEAYRREEITRSKLLELGTMVGVAAEQMESTLETTGIEAEPADADHHTA